MNGVASARALLLATVLSVPPWSIGALQSEERLERLELGVNLSQANYDSAQAAYRLALDSLDQASENFGVALLSLGSAREADDEDRLEEALAAALAPGRQMSVSLASSREAEARLDSTRNRLVRALVAWQRELQSLAEITPDDQSRHRYDALYEAARERIAQLEVLEESPALPRLALVEPDPRDGPDEWRFKASLCRRLAQEASELLENMNSDLAELRTRQLAERQREDFLRDTRRFGGISPAVVGESDQAEPPPPDSASGLVLPLTLDERITELTEQIEQIQDYRDRLLTRAAEFEARGDGGGTP